MHDFPLLVFNHGFEFKDSVSNFFFFYNNIVHEERKTN